MISLRGQNILGEEKINGYNLRGTEALGISTFKWQNTYQLPTLSQAQEKQCLEFFIHRKGLLLTRPDWSPLGV